MIKLWKRWRASRRLKKAMRIAKSKKVMQAVAKVCLK